MAGGRKSQPAQPPTTTTTLILDNGAHTLKAGLVSTATVDIPDPHIIPNCIARTRNNKTYVSADIAQCRDVSELQFRRPVEKGFIVNWEAQKEIWDRLFVDDKAILKCDPKETRLLLAEQPNGLPALQTSCDQIVFEEYGFASYYRGIGSTFNAYHDIQNFFRTPRDVPTVANTPAEVLLVVDSGYSHTTITPILAGRPLHSAIRRLDVGGKLLTNYMARLLSLRHFDMRNETYIVNEMKEAACFVSSDFKADLERTWKGTKGEKRLDWLKGDLAKDYILPDFHTTTTGQLVDYNLTHHSKSKRLEAGIDADILTLRNERFAVPELIFSPSDMGMHQPGLADLLTESLHALPIGLWPGLLANIMVVGGNALFDGFIQRLQKEVVQRFPDECVVRVARPADPVTSSWHGAAHLANHADLGRVIVSREEYFENGAGWVGGRFARGGW